MKKLISVFIAALMLLMIIGCACGQQTAVETRGDLSVLCDKEITKDLLAYFQANQNVIVTAVLLDSNTDYEKLTGSVALLKDEATAEKLKAKGWTEAQNWTDAQKETNANMFDFIVLVAPSISESGKIAAKYLTDWLVGDGSYERKVVTMSGGCSCKKIETNVVMRSDAPALFQSGLFGELVNP